MRIFDGKDGEEYLEKSRALLVAELAYAGKTGEEIRTQLQLNSKEYRRLLNSDDAKAFFIKQANETKIRSSAKHSQMLDRAITEAWKHVLKNVQDGHIPTCIKVIEWEARKDAGAQVEQGDTTIQIMMPRVEPKTIKPDVEIEAKEDRSEKED